LRHIGEQHILLPIAWQLFAAQLAATYSAAHCGTIISSLFCSSLWNNYQQHILQLLLAQLSAACSAAHCGTIISSVILQLLLAQLSAAYSAAPCGTIISSLF
jgi:hypothetical protein